MKKLLLNILFVASAFTSIAQQLPNYSQYIFDPVAINPAAVGSKNIVFGALTHRQQFVGFEGAPVTQKLTINAPIQSKNMGVGIRALHDKVGVTEAVSVMGMYSYRIGIGGGKVSFGVEGGFVNQTIDFTNLVRTDQVDIALSNQKLSLFTPDASFGMLYYTDKFTIGFSSYHLFEGKTNFTGVKRDIVSKLARHTFVSMGYAIPVGEKLEIIPSVLFKAVKGAPSQFDLNTNIVWNKMISIGAGYRTGDGLMFLLRYMVKEAIVIGYSYDLTTSKLATYSSGTHEIMVGYQIKLLPPASQKVTDPRYYF